MLARLEPQTQHLPPHLRERDKLGSENLPRIAFSRADTGSQPLLGKCKGHRKELDSIKPNARLQRTKNPKDLRTPWEISWGRYSFPL